MRLKYIHATTGSIVAFIVFAIAVFVIPSHGPSDEVEILLTIATFLFAIFGGFIISRLNNRYDEYRETLNILDGYVSSLYHNAVLIGKGFAKKIVPIIDKYYVTAYSYDVGVYPQKVEAYYMKLLNVLKKEKKTNIYVDEFNEIVTEIEKADRKILTLAEEKLVLGQWIIITSLGIIILYSLFYLRAGSLISNIITVLLSTALVLVILLIRDLNNLRLGGKYLAYESGQLVFDMIGKPRFHVDIDIKEGVKPHKGKDYRLAITDKKGKILKIKLIKAKKK